MHSYSWRKQDNALFYSFAVLLLWLPIPLGSDSEVSSAIVQIWVAIQTIAILFYYQRELPLSRLTAYRFLFLGLIGFQFWIAWQIVPLPVGLLTWISPNSSEIYQLIGVSYGTISIDKSLTTQALTKGVASCLFLFNAIMVITTAKRLQQICMVVIASASLQAMYGVLIQLANAKVSPVLALPLPEAMAGSFRMPSHYANYLLVALCLAVGLIVKQLHTTSSVSSSWSAKFNYLLANIWTGRVMIPLCFSVILFALVIGNYTLAMVVFFTTMLFGSAITLTIYRKRSPTLITLIAGVVGLNLVVITSLFMWGDLAAQFKAISWLSDNREQGLWWGLHIIKDYPITGSGLATFQSLFPSYAENYLLQSDSDLTKLTQNDFLRFATEVGVPIALGLISLVLYCMLRCVNTIQRRKSRTMRSIALGSVMAIFTMLTHMGIDFHLHSMANILTFILVLFFANATAIMPAKAVTKRKATAPPA